jgi:hypothetical protein
MLTKDIKNILDERPNALFTVKVTRSATWGHPCVLTVRPSGNGFYARTVKSDGLLGDRWQPEVRNIVSITPENYKG